MTSILVTGGDGRLARPMREFLPDAHYLSHQQCDVSSWSRLSAVGESYRPTCIIHLGAETRYNAPKGAYFVANICGTGYVISLARMHNARVVFASTVYVYPCTAGPYAETDVLQPVGDYAWSKLAGEAAVRSLDDHLIIRGCWYDKLLWERAVTDGYSTRIPARQAAEWIAQLALSDERGVMNIGGPRRSLYDIVREQNPDVQPITCAELPPLPYAFPKEACVDTTKHQDFIARQVWQVDGA